MAIEEPNGTPPEEPRVPVPEEEAGGTEEPSGAEEAGGTEEPRGSDERGEAEQAPEAEPAPEPAPTAPQSEDAGETAVDAGAGKDEAGERPKRRPRKGDGEKAEEVVPGADLEPDLVLEDQQPGEGDRFGEANLTAAYGEEETPPEADAASEAEPERREPQPEYADAAPPTPMELAADARYHATGKRKTAVARVILRPGSGAYTVNGRSLEEFFPRPRLQHTARQPLAAAGYDARMDVVAKLHGGGVAAQAGALRHGVARALVEADPNLRGELKRHGFLTRDPRVKERKKAGLKKARKRPQFSKR